MKQKHELAQEDYMQGMKYKELAEKYEVSINTIKSWKKRHNWNRKKVHTNNEKGCTQNDKPVKKIGAPFGSKNALGNKGGNGAPKGNKHAVGHGAPKGNRNAATHGLYATVVYENLSDEDKRLFDLSQDIEGQEQELQVARFKLAKLIREQKEHRLKGVATTVDGSYTYILRDDFYTDAINKAIDMISKLETRINKSKLEREKLEMQKKEHEKKLLLMEVQIEKTKADTARIKGEDGDEYEDDGFKEALEGKVEEVWEDHDDNSET